MIREMKKDTTFCVLLLIWEKSSNGDAFNACARSRDALNKRRDQQITLVAADKKPFLKLFHVELDVILVNAKQMDVKDVTRNESV